MTCSPHTEVAELEARVLALHSAGCGEEEEEPDELSFHSIDEGAMPAIITDRDEEETAAVDALSSQCAASEGPERTLDRAQLRRCLRATSDLESALDAARKIGKWRLKRRPEEVFHCPWCEEVGPGEGHDMSVIGEDLQGRPVMQSAWGVNLGTESLLDHMIFTMEAALQR